MTVDLFIQILHTHLSALESPAWPRPHNLSSGPALFLDVDDTRALIEELTRLKREPEPSAHLRERGCRCDRSSRESSNA
jgi:hypothetical protein